MQNTAVRPRPTVRDVVVALVVGALAIGVSAAIAHDASPEGGLDWIAYTLLFVSSAALVVRRRHPVGVLIVTAVCAVAYPHLGSVPTGPFPLPMMVAVFTVAAGGLRTWAIGVSVGFFAMVLLGVLAGYAPDNALPLVSGWLVAALVAGEVARSRRDYLAEVEQRAFEAERTREEEALRRATQERLRIAREVHDVLSHSISMINVQAGVAVHLLDTQPQQARTALVAIKQASKDALRDLRATMGVLRDVDAGDGGRAPTQGLARLEELVAGAGTAGVRLEITSSGDRRELPAGVDLAAYRIVQQSISNIVRHAGATAGTVALRFGADDLTIVVDNDRGTRDGGSTAGAGDGIRGMRERVEALGGAFEAGPRPEGGFRVRARLPVHHDRSREERDGGDG